MIRVNLLKTGDIAASSSAQGPVDALATGDSGDSESSKRQGLMKLLLLFIPVIAFHYYQNEVVLEGKRRKLVVARNQLKQLKAENQERGPIAEEIKRIRQEEQRYRDRIQIIKGLSENRSLTIKAMDAIQTLIPEKIWLSRISVKGNQLSVAGFSINELEISNFMQQMQDTVFFQNINLKNLSEVRLERGNFKEFEVTCNLRGT